MSQRKQPENLEETKAGPPDKYGYYRDLAYDVGPQAELVYKRQDVISGQRRLALTLAKQVGSNLFHGRSVMDVSLPVSVFEPASTLAKAAALCAHCPLLLKLKEENDSVERMRLIIKWTVASLQLGLSQSKPFASTTGETLQARVGELWVYAENLPGDVPTLLLVGEGLRIHGGHKIVAHTYPNSAKVVTEGRWHVEVGGDRPAHYTVTHPVVVLNGIMMGNRTFKYTGEVTIEDTTNKLYGQIRFNPYEKGFFSSMFSKKQYRDDHTKGFITRNRDLLGVSKPSVFESKDIVSICEGNWIERLSFDGKLYWEMGQTVPSPVTRTDNPLPSDDSLRPDIEALRRGNAEAAQRLKEAVELGEKRDNKLREAVKGRGSL